MKLRNPWLTWLLGRTGAILVRSWMGTVRMHIKCRGEHADPSDPELRRRFIYAFWHEDILFAVGGPWSQRKFCVLVSQSGDGELLAQVFHGLGTKLARGSSRRGGSRAILEMLAHGQSQSLHFGVTPDGPRGPRRHVHPGVVYLASKAGLPIVPCGIAYQNAWRAGSWDRFAVPMPFSGAYCYTGPLVHVPSDIKRREIEPYRQLVQARMLEQSEAAEAWARGTPFVRPATKIDSPHVKAA